MVFIPLRVVYVGECSNQKGEQRLKTVGWLGHTWGIMRERGRKTETNLIALQGRPHQDHWSHRRHHIIGRNVHSLPERYMEGWGKGERELREREGERDHAAV